MAYASFFFTNFSNEFQEKDLWRVFQHWKRVLYVFISKKLNFGFVKFHGIRDEYTLERQLDLFGSVHGSCRQTNSNTEGKRSQCTAYPILKKAFPNNLFIYSI